MLVSPESGYYRELNLGIFSPLKRVRWDADRKGKLSQTLPMVSRSLLPVCLRDCISMLLFLFPNTDTKKHKNKTSKNFWALDFTKPIRVRQRSFGSRKCSWTRNSKVLPSQTLRILISSDDLLLQSHTLQAFPNTLMSVAFPVILIIGVVSSICSTVRVSGHGLSSLLRCSASYMFSFLN